MCKKKEGEKMIYDTFLFTRDEDDYGWRQKPEYLPKDLYKKCRTIINLREKFPEWEEEKWKRNLFGICVDGYPVIGRVIATNAEDPFGRPIFSFEGITVEKIIKRYILDIANVIYFFSSQKESFRDLYVDGKLESKVHVEDKFNPLDFPNHTEEKQEEEDGAFRKLLLDSGNYDLDYSFLYGEDAGQLFSFIGKEYSLKRVYDTKAQYSNEDTDEDMLIRVEPVEMKEENSEKADLYLEILEIKKNVYGYRWVMKTKDLSVSMKTKIKRIKKETDIGVLSEEAGMLREYLFLTGK